MRKYLLIFSFLPIVGFCNDVEFSYKAYAYNTSGKLLTATSFKGSDFFNAKFDTVFSLILNQSWVPLSFNTLNLRLSHPSFSSPFTNSVQNSSFPFLGSNGLAYSFGYFPETANIFVTIIHLYNNGYRNDNFIKTFVDNGFNKPSTCNVSPLNIYLDVLQGTNTLYRQIVLNSLKELNQNLLSIDDNLFNFVDMYRSINSSKLGDYSSLSNTIIGLEQQYLLPNGFNGLLQDLDPSYWDLTTEVGKLAYSERQKQIANSLPFINSLMNLIKSQENFNQDQNNPLNDFLKNAGDKINKSVNDSLDGIQSSIDGSVDAIRSLNTNWVEEAKRELGTLNTSVSNQNTTIERVISHSNAVKVVGADGGAIQVTGAVTLDTHGEDLHVWLDGPVSLDVPTLDTLTSDNDLIEQTLIDFKSLFEQWYKDDQDNSWLKFFEMARDWRINEIADNTSNQVEVAWEIHTAVTNILASMTNDYKSLLLTDYDQFVSNGVYDSMVSLSRYFHDDCLKYGSATYSDMLDSLGLGSGEGRWWQYITAHLGLMGNLSVTNYYMMSYVFSNLVETIQYANDQFENEGGFLGQATKLIKSIPKEADVVSQIDNITNTINSAALGFNEVYTDLGSTSNQFNQAISTYYVKKALPDNIQLQILPGIEPFRIPVGERRELFDLLRMGMAFAISIVNLILLPKFILKLFTLFFGVVDSQIKIASMDQTPV